MPNIRVAIVEDAASLRNSLAALLKVSPGFECVCACATAEEALRQIPCAKPEVVLMDIHLPGRSGIECVRELKEQLPHAQFIMLTIESEKKQVFDSLAAGATGYLVKSIKSENLLTAIQEAHRGGSPMSSRIARMLVQSFHRPGPRQPSSEALTSREEEVLSLIAKGCRTKEVAGQLGISPLTVETHIRNIYEKFHVRSRAGAVAQFLKGRG